MKRIVHYTKCLPPITVGFFAYVVPLDHPDTWHVSNNKLIRTSQVLSHDPKTGIFETRNSIYEPVQIQ